MLGGTYRRAKICVCMCLTRRTIFNTLQLLLPSLLPPPPNIIPCLPQPDTVLKDLCTLFTLIYLILNIILDVSPFCRKGNMVSGSLINLCKITTIQSYNPYSISSNLLRRYALIHHVKFSIAVITSLVCLSIVVIDFQKLACSHFMRWSPFKCHLMFSRLNSSFLIVQWSCWFYL